MRVFITGGTGLIGSKISAALIARGDKPVIVTRNALSAAKKMGNEPDFVEANPKHSGEWMKEIDGCDAVINLAGENLFAHRWNSIFKTELRNSRIFVTENLVNGINQATEKPKMFISTSAIGFYGDVPSGELGEDSSAGNDFVAKLVSDWESIASELDDAEVRTAILRVGVVLALESGALKQMLPPFKAGVGGRVGTGKQWMSWIHVDDLVKLYLTVLDERRYSGIINATAPVPVTNQQFSNSLAKALHRPCFFPVPKFALGLLYGEAAEIITGGQRVIPRRARNLGFTYDYPTIDEALGNLLA